MSSSEFPMSMNVILRSVLSFTEQCIRGSNLYHDTLPKTHKTYLKASYEADTGFIQSTLSGLNLLDHRTHEGMVFINDGGTPQRRQ